jgi:hypothetical protein
MRRSCLVALMSISSTLGVFGGCRSLPDKPEVTSRVQESLSSAKACKIPERLNFVPVEPSGPILGLIALEQASGLADDSDFSLHLVPSDLDEIRSLSCASSVCEASVTKPLTLTRESKVALTANLHIKYQSTRDEHGALVSRQVMVGGKKAHISIGKILGVDVEVGAFFKQDLQKKGFRGLSVGTYAQADGKTQLPLLNLRGQIVADGLNLNDLHVSGASLSLIRQRAHKDNKVAVTNSTSTAQLRDEMRRITPKNRPLAPDLTWATLAEQCAEEFYGSN